MVRVTVLILFIVIGLGGLASIFFSSSSGLALTEFFISFGGLLVSVILAKPDILRGWKQMLQGKLEILLRIITTILLISIIFLQFLIIKNQISANSPIAKRAPSGPATVQPSQTPPTPTPNATSVKINSPSDGATVSLNEAIKGTSNNIPAGNVIWILIQPEPEKSNICYPQPTQAIISQADGSWSSGAQVGGGGDKGIKFTIYAFVADKELQNKINQALLV